jgi:predicted metal-binding membrane protein
MSTDLGSLLDRESVEGGVFDVTLDRTTAVVAAMLALDAVWWLLLYNGDVPMPGMTWLMKQGVPMAAPGAMELGVFHVGTLDAVVGYVSMWGVMMWAMMHPAMTRFTREYAASHRGSHADAALSVASFLTSYLLVWTLSAVVPLALHAVLPGGIYGFTRSHTTLALGGALVLTGLYQLSSFKQSLLRSCCSAVESHADDIPRAFEEGASHGVRCVLVCFGPFFVLMPVFGEMNFFWMVGLTAVVTMERLPSWGREIAVSTGLVSLVAGVAVCLLGPDLPVAFTMAM